MSSKQEATYYFGNDDFESMDDDHPQRKGIAAFTAAKVNESTSTKDASNKKRQKPSSATVDYSTKKIRSGSSTNESEEDFNLHKTDNNNYHGDGEFDLCTPEGQVAASRAGNSNGASPMTWEQAKHAARREYNRVNAARARQRHKEDAETRDQQIAKLKLQVEQLTQLNEVLMNYISEMQATSNTTPVLPSHASLHPAAFQVESTDAKKSATYGFPPTGTEALMSLLKQQQSTEDGRPPHNSLAYNHQTHLLHDTSQLQRGRADILNNILRVRSPDLTGSTSASLGRIAQTLQLQQLLAERTKNNNLALPFSITRGVHQTRPNPTTDPLWDVLLSVQQFNSMLPSAPSGAPK